MEALKAFRESQGKSRPEMAKLLGVSLSLYEKVELGQRTATSEFISKLKQVFPVFDANIFFEKKLHA